MSKGSPASATFSVRILLNKNGTRSLRGVTEDALEEFEAQFMQPSPSASSQGGAA